jgi:hypothetical protein
MHDALGDGIGRERGRIDRDRIRRPAERRQVSLTVASITFY